MELHRLFSLIQYLQEPHAGMQRQREGTPDGDRGDQARVDFHTGLIIVERGLNVTFFMTKSRSSAGVIAPIAAQARP